MHSVELYSKGLIARSTIGRRSNWFMQEVVYGDIGEPLALHLADEPELYLPCIRYFHAFNYIENPFMVENRLIF